MKIFSVEQIRLADKYTIERQNISSGELMERAGKAVFKWMHRQLNGSDVKIHLFCGIGNNGGDGLVVARYLLEQGYAISVYVVNFSDNRSKDFLLNFDRIKNLKYWPQLLTEDDDLPFIESNDIVVDAIFGIGLNRPPITWVSKLIHHINKNRAFVLSIDIPSGLYMDKGITTEDAVVKADYTLTFQLPKLPFLLPETGRYTQYWEVLDIGQDTQFLYEEPSNLEYVDKWAVLNKYKPRDRFSHKGTYGHSLIIGGSYGKIGAALMCSEAALHAGSGLVTAFVPKCGYQTIQTAFPEAMVVTDVNDNFITDINFSIDPSVIGIGPGLGKHPKTIKAFTSFLKRNKAPLVIDADGINILSENKELIQFIKGKAVLTPHPKELERLIGVWKDDYDKLEKTKQFSTENDVVILIKGAYTVTVYHEKMSFNSTGNPGMATGGSGDVLTGIICGLLAQGYTLFDATVLGVYIHGKAGDLAVLRAGVEALTATDLIDFTGDAFLDLIKKDPVDYMEGNAE
ncbi:NAD(P)H-hydrate dehydratase [Galbibacter pacificus]|uniref:Bifunctional NAD(P)H-hydrate repair enzyme n=1 Tax=Galbibacter pacificus TaxID=2996052 RepID=A0ABT6FUU4_9FLAO|nr:NAD(P)H-hydrate dehydratase [Galbibacter pacificus]MDG3583670.1 NAD(P)H-hydrate dehydratase [Galbibacter pacificus]MDG3586854.1 NAD(P)H-hydrate dehydratase [Galbibacter pacificus]